MSSYAYFAGYYDELTRNVDYGKQADYLEALCHRLGHAPAYPWIWLAELEA